MNKAERAKFLKACQAYGVDENGLGGHDPESSECQACMAEDNQMHEACVAECQAAQGTETEPTTSETPSKASEGQNGTDSPSDPQNPAEPILTSPQGSQEAVQHDSGAKFVQWEGPGNYLVQEMENFGKVLVRIKGVKPGAYELDAIPDDMPVIGKEKPQIDKPETTAEKPKKAKAKKPAKKSGNSKGLVLANMIKAGGTFTVKDVVAKMQEELPESSEKSSTMMTYLLLNFAEKMGTVSKIGVGTYQSQSIQQEEAQNT